MTFLTAQEAFEFFYSYILRKGQDRGDNLCIFNTLFEISYPKLNLIHTPGRKWNVNYAEREFQWYLTGERSVSEIKKHAPIWDTMHEGDDLVWSNYGYWWLEGDQLIKMIERLKENPLDRKAIIVHYSAERSPQFIKDMPCNLVLNFFISDNKLNLTVMARSIDLWYGFCNDQYVFSRLMTLVSGELNKPIGTMSYFITNFHIYKKQINHDDTTSALRKS